MTDKEKEYLNDVIQAVSKWEFEATHSRGFDGLCMHVKFNPEQWKVYSEEMWNAIVKIVDKWGIYIDNDQHNYYLYLA